MPFYLSAAALNRLVGAAPGRGDNAAGPVQGLIFFNIRTYGLTIYCFTVTFPASVQTRIAGVLPQ